jgi:hypothetical protein
MGERAHNATRPRRSNGAYIGDVYVGAATLWGSVGHAVQDLMPFAWE